MEQEQSILNNVLKHNIKQYKENDTERLSKVHIIFSITLMITVSGKGIQLGTESVNQDQSIQYYQK